MQVRNRFAALEYIDEEINTEEGSNKQVELNGKDVVHTYTETSSAVLGQKKRTHKDWLSEDTWTAIEERKQLKVQWMKAKSQKLKERYGALYSEADKRVKRHARTDKRVYMDNLAAEAERAATHQEQGTVFRITKQTCGGSHSSNVIIRDKQGNMLTSDKEQERTWAEHFLPI